MAIEYRVLTPAERQSPDHFCNCCEILQKRYELHHCVATERWKAAKAAMNVGRTLPPPMPLQAEPELVEIEPNADENP